MPSLITSIATFTDLSIQLGYKDIMEAVWLTFSGAAVWGLPAIILGLLVIINPSSASNPIGQRLSVWLVEHYVSNLGFILHMFTSVYAFIIIWAVDGKYREYRFWFALYYTSFATLFECT